MSRLDLFLGGDVMTGRGIDQILPTPSPPELYEPHIRDAREYVALAEQRSGEVPRAVSYDYPWGDALGEIARVAPAARIVNLETAVTRSDDAWPDKGIHYRMHPANVPCLEALGIDVCVLANNHVLDWGRKGLAETLGVLRRAGIQTAGAGRTLAEAEAPSVVPLPDGGRVLVFAVGHRSSGIPVAWAARPDLAGVALLRGLGRDEADALAERAMRARRPGDVVVVSIHWGTNWGHEIPDEQVAFAHALVEGGVDVVHGHSSHHARVLEIHEGKPILYGSGDLLNDYEGIEGIGPLRDEIAPLYFAGFERTSRGVELVELRIVPMRTRRMRLERAPAEASEPLAHVLRRFGTDVAIEPDGALVARPHRAASASRGRLGMVTDLYELTMASRYRALGMNDRATFSLFVRKLPGTRSYLVAAGLEEALDRLERCGLEDGDVDHLVRAGTLSREEAGAIARTRFTGDVRAVREGRIVFADEPILEVDAPLIEAQLVETLLLNAVHYATCAASKAARCVAAARGKALVDFGLRRAPGIEAGLVAARACRLVGFAATSNVQAGMKLNMATSGTVAHSFVEACPSERAAFEAWMMTGEGPVTLLVDTYDTLHGVRLAVDVVRALGAAGRERLAAIRLDSGDLDALSRAARRILDDAGLEGVRIFASGGLDEWAIDALVGAGAPIDGFGVGTRIGMSADAPVLDMAYKLVEYAGTARLKLSEQKSTLVGKKQIWRRRSGSGRYAEDLVACADEAAPGPDWEPLLETVVRAGERVSRPSLEELRVLHAEEMRRLPDALRAIASPAAHPVGLSRELASRQRAAVEATLRREGVSARER